MHDQVVGPLRGEFRLTWETSPGAVATAEGLVRTDLTIEEVSTTSRRCQVDEVVYRSWGQSIVARTRGDAREVRTVVVGVDDGHNSDARRAIAVESGLRGHPRQPKGRRVPS